MRFQERFMRGFRFNFLLLLVSVYGFAKPAFAFADPVPFGFELTTVSQGESVLAAMKLGRSSIDGVIDVAKGLPKAKNCRAIITSDAGGNLIGIAASLNRVAMDYIEGDHRMLDDGDRQEIIRRLKLVEPALKEVSRQVEILGKTQKQCPSINVKLLVKKLQQIKSGLGTVDDLSAKPVPDSGGVVSGQRNVAR